ncbi:uncharacterized protein LOC113561210 [Rhopalosiphum maidis]|uniref:uncharacterized protein LOC113561210 n=1 Tax=Rhopalosiphum maidis TaxID=43146 RepID=UPI000EFEEE2E|nr:uncharacterized protein LOC113561210 [Rhopalosiphum maidis]
MIWLFFKNCSKNKKSKTIKSDDNYLQVNNSKSIINELLPKLDVFDDLDTSNDNVFFMDKHFAYLSIVDPYNEFKESTPEKTEADKSVVIENESEEINEVDDLEASIKDAMVINNRFGKVTQKHLKSLQCPFTWDLEPEVWKKNIANRIEKKYGKYNTNISSVRFSFEKYISNLIISCGLFKMNKVDKAHDKLIDIWGWLDKLDDKNEPTYLAIRDGLKHIVMSTLCHILFTMNRAQCQQLFEMITRFNNLDSKSRAAINALHAAVCIEIGGKSLQNVVQYAKTACELDPDTVQWNYFLSVAMTAQRQYLNTNISCPTNTEFDSIQQAIILSNEPNPYFNFHRMHLMTNKILYHYHFDNNRGENTGNENAMETIKKDFLNIIELIKAIVSIEPEDPHLVVKCAKSLMTLPYLTEDNIFLIKQIISIAVNMAFHDFTVIRAIQKSIEIFRELVFAYTEMNEKKSQSENINIQCKVKNQEDDLENDFILINEKYEKGSKPVLDLINLFEKYDGYCRWKIMAQICSYSILFKESSNFLIGVEQFMMLINEKNIANSDIIKKHRSIFIKDHSKVFNLAELVCNEIKLAITFGCIKNQDQTQLYLDQLTKIMDVCQLKSKKVNPTLILEIIGSSEKENQNNVFKQIDTVNHQNDPQATKQIVSKNSTKQRRLKHTSNNHHTRAPKSKPRRRHHRYD